MSKLLLVEDDELSGDEVKESLERNNHLVDLAVDGRSAWDHLRVVSYDLLILDWNLPDTSGLELLKQLRAGGNMVPVLMLTGHADMEHKTMGFEGGADDYLSKPVNLKELALRVTALLRRPAAQISSLLKVGDVEVDLETYKVTKEGKSIKLSPTEFNLLITFLRHPNVVLSPDVLIEKAWPTDTEVSSELVRKYVYKLRDKIDKSGNLIKTVHGVGYAWEKS
ncbi:MAG: response regulator transcription factor [Candidatus Obscuribacterales bacterium]|nr:response regulator transcription factor [Candidatus Obscuribacterales bacterium]